MTGSTQPNAERPVDIVFVHGLRGNGSASWCKATAPSATIKSLLQQVPGTCVREYDSKKELHEEFDWESFLDIEASSLLKFLGLENSPDGHRQIILIGHGLGGNIIKNAIKILIEQHFRHHFLDLIIAIISSA